MLSLVHNANLVKLIGYCVDGDHRILVYELMPNGSLENHLLGMLNIKFLLMVSGIFPPMLVNFSIFSRFRTWKEAIGLVF